MVVLSVCSVSKVSSLFCTISIYFAMFGESLSVVVSSFISSHVLEWYIVELSLKCSYVSIQYISNEICACKINYVSKRIKID